MKLQRTLLAATSTVLLFGAAACSSSDGDSAEAPTTAAASSDTAAPVADTATAAPATADASGVTISGSRFDPLELSVAVGATVTFTNTDPFAHTVTSRDDSAVQFDSDNLGSDETFEVTFADAGTYNYFCQIHPTMRASIVVG